MRTKHHVLLFAVAVAITGCSNSQVSQVEYDALSAERDSLLRTSVSKDSLINAFLTSFNEIENNLINIRQRQESLTLEAKANVEFGGNVVDDVKENIRVINELMEQNQKKISTLSAIVSRSNNKIDELNGLITVMQERLINKNQELIGVNKLLAEKNKMLAPLYIRERKVIK